MHTAREIACGARDTRRGAVCCLHLPSLARESETIDPTVSFDDPIFHALQVVAVGIVNVLKNTDLDSPLLFAHPELCVPLAGNLPVSPLVQVSDLDH